MDETSSKKQSIGGFKVLAYSVKKAKDSEKIRLVLEAVVDDIAAGECDMGDVMKALLDHQVGEVDVGLSVFVDS